VPPFAYSFWQSLGSAALLAIVVHGRGDRVGMTWAHLKSYVVIGGIGIGIPTALLTVVAPKLPAVALTLGLALTPSFTYAASLIIGIEKFRALGVGGLLIGFAGVTIVVGPGNVLDQPGSWAWYILGLSRWPC
jgi:drug/metabolite transporter (DMT)-like permease